jgi:hypothetical protein
VKRTVLSHYRRPDDDVPLSRRESSSDLYTLLGVLLERLTQDGPVRVVQHEKGVYYLYSAAQGKFEARLK